jgi:hypothetical protein
MDKRDFHGGKLCTECDGESVTIAHRKAEELPVCYVYLINIERGDIYMSVSYVLSYIFFAHMYYI